MLIGSPSFAYPRWLSAVGVDVLGWSWRWWSVVARAPAGGGTPCVLKPINQHLEAGGEPLVAVVDPDMLTQGDQGGEAVGGQRTEELVQLGSDRRVADPLLVDRGGRAADGKADGVVEQQEEGQAGVAVAEPGRLQWCKERFGQGQGMGAQRVAGLEDGGHPGMGDRKS